MSNRIIYLALFFSLLCQCLLMDICTAEPAKTGQMPKTTTVPGNSQEVFPPVLMPEQFFGPAAMGYAAAKAAPHVCSKLFCYCGCDITDKHTCLLDCFTSLHGADCHICQEEALQALRMTRDDEPIAKIQKEIDESYASKYPFKEESPALKKYKSSTRKYSLVPETSSSTALSSSNDACCTKK